MLLHGQNKKYAVLIITLLLVGSAAWFFISKPPVPAKPPVSPPAPVTTATDTIPAPGAAQWLADSTHVYLLGEVKLTPAAGYPGRREITLDGDAFFDIPSGGKPLTIHTKLLTLVIKGKAALRVTTPSKEEWAEVDVIKGNVIVYKAYKSTFDKPDTLGDGQMEMLNRTIDLMEKEVFDPAVLKAWRERQPVSPM